RAQGLSCDTTTRDQRIAAAAASLRDRLGGARDAACAGKSLTPSTLGHGAVCGAPCSQIVLFDMADLASCAICQAEALNEEALASAYGARPPLLPAVTPASARACQKSLDDAASLYADGIAKA